MSETVRITLPDGSTKEAPKGMPIRDFVAQEIGEGLARAAIGAEVNGRAVDLSAPLETDGTLRVITPRDPEALDWLRHSSAHILASAIKHLFPDARFDDGPPTETGFFYDVALDHHLTPEDLEAIEKEALRIIREKQPFVRTEKSRAEALAWAEANDDKYKKRIIEQLPEDATISFYTHGDFTDLCRGPHIPDTGRVGAFKVFSVSGAYWGGDESSEQLQRVHGTAFFDKKDLKRYLKQLEEARRRDHRRLGKELDLFSINENVGGGLILWHPKGAIVRKVLEDYWRDQHLKAGYQLVYTPHVGRSKLWETSGHLDFYREGMYPAMELEGVTYYVKPMNCPFHMTIYGERRRSYRELPMKLFELGTVYRYERSGTMHGLMRVRGFTQDDSHLFVAPEDLEAQVVEVVRFCLQMLRSLGFTDFEAYVSTRPEKAVGAPEAWARAEAALKEAAKKAGLEAGIDEGGGAFYGPKIDLKLRDAIGRSWQCSTVQFDFNLPERFDLTYVGEDNQAHRPYVIHRALLGSIERFMGILIEHYAGAFPMWLAPVQAGVVTIADRHLEAADALAARLAAEGIRVDVDRSSEKMGAKIRRYALEKVPYILVVGDKEVERGGASVRLRGGKDEGFLTTEVLVERLVGEAAPPELGVPPSGPADLPPSLDLDA